MHDPESVLENERYKILWDFETQMDHLISARRPDQVIVNKKMRTSQIDHIIKLKEREKIDEYVDLAKELKITMEHDGDGDSN